MIMEGAEDFLGLDFKRQTHYCETLLHVYNRDKPFFHFKDVGIIEIKQNNLIYSL